MKNIVLGFSLVLFLFTSCTKPPGEGGNSVIKGKLKRDIRLVVTNPGSYQYTEIAADESVYIIYGDNTSPDDNVDTNYDGEFEFRNLRPGDYTVYVYSDDTTGSQQIDDKRMPIIMEVDINDKKEEVDLGEITIYGTN